MWSAGLLLYVPFSLGIMQYEHFLSQPSAIFIYTLFLFVIILFCFGLGKGVCEGSANMFLPVFSKDPEAYIL